MSEEVERIAAIREAIGNQVRDVLGLGIYKNGPQVKNGEVHITDAPGFGMEIDGDFVEQ